MSKFDENHVLVTGILLWDGITQPEYSQVNSKWKHTVKLAIPAGSPELNELDEIARKQLNEGTFRGNFPSGGRWPISQIGPAEFNGEFPGWGVINAITYNGQPQVFDVNGQQLDAMVFGQQLYPGAQIRLLVHCYDYNTAQKGLAFGLDGVQIMDATRPKLAISGGVDAAAAFGGQAAAGPAPGGQPAAPNQPPAQPGPAPGGQPAAPAGPAPGGQPVQPAHDFVNGPQQPATPPAPGGPPVVPQMTAKANGIPYDQWIAAGWTDELLLQHGYMQ